MRRHAQPRKLRQRRERQARHDDGGRGADREREEVVDVFDREVAAYGRGEEADRRDGEDDTHANWSPCVAFSTASPTSLKVRNSP